jgi:hypothetical protein
LYNDAHHLPICEDRSIETFHHIINNASGAKLVNTNLRGRKLQRKEMSSEDVTAAAQHIRGIADPSLACMMMMVMMVMMAQNL